MKKFFSVVAIILGITMFGFYTFALVDIFTNGWLVQYGFLYSLSFVVCAGFGIFILYLGLKKLNSQIEEKSNVKDVEIKRVYKVKK